MKLVGEKFNYITVLARSNRKSKDGKSLYRCKCDCGKLMHIKRDSIPKKVSCGCHKNDPNYTRKVKHGMSGTKIYRAWSSIKERCNPNYPYNYWNYKDIRVCDEWANDFKAFYEWSMANKYIETKEFNFRLYRKDYTRDYEPDNCEWVIVMDEINDANITRFEEWINKRNE